jgi:hypothetical protein
MPSWQPLRNRSSEDSIAGKKGEIHQGIKAHEAYLPFCDLGFAKKEVLRKESRFLRE